MKGPYERLKYDLRRVFECPHCHQRIRVPGSVTSVPCTCSGVGPDSPPRYMKWIEDGPRRIPSGSPTNRRGEPPSDSTS
jgi:hypothetical protein